jgi:hypothetical protein
VAGGPRIRPGGGELGRQAENCLRLGDEIRLTAGAIVRRGTQFGLRSCDRLTADAKRVAATVRNEHRDDNQDKEDQARTHAEPCKHGADAPEACSVHRGTSFPRGPSRTEP